MKDWTGAVWGTYTVPCKRETLKELSGHGKSFENLLGTQSDELVRKDIDPQGAELKDCTDSREDDSLKESWPST